MSVTLDEGLRGRLVLTRRFALPSPEATVIDLASIQVPANTVLRLIVWADVCVAAAFLIGVIGFAICCGAKAVRERKADKAARRCAPRLPETGVASPARVRQVRSVSGVGALPGAILLALGLTACSPRFHHLDGTSLTPIGTPLSLENGWIVFDSCTGGLHALIEIQVEVDDPRLRPLDLEQVAFRYTSSYRWRTGQVRVDGPFCPRDRSNRLVRAQAEFQATHANRVAYGTAPRCTYNVLAQFDLDRLPEAGDSVLALHGDRLMQVAWR